GKCRSKVRRWHLEPHGNERTFSFIYAGCGVRLVRLGDLSDLNGRSAEINPPWEKQWRSLLRSRAVAALLQARSLGGRYRLGVVAWCLWPACSHPRWCSSMVPR